MNSVEGGLFTFLQTAPTIAAYVGGAGAAAYRDLVLADSPSVYLRFGDQTLPTAADSSGNSLDGVYHNAPTLNVAGALMSDSNTAVGLNGTSQYVSVPENTLLDTGDVFTLEGWFKFSSLTGNPRLLDKGTGGYGLRLLTSSGILQFLRNGFAIIATSSITLSINTWYHVVVVKSGSVTSIYVNGIDVTLAGSNDTMVSTATDLFVGSLNGAGNFVAGTVDEVAVYATALSFTRVVAHYRAAIQPLSVSPSIPRIYPLVLRQDSLILPALTYHTVSGHSELSVDGKGNRLGWKRIQISAWSNARFEAKNIIEAIRELVNGYIGLWDDVNVSVTSFSYAPDMFDHISKVSHSPCQITVFFNEV